MKRGSKWTTQERDKLSMFKHSILSLPVQIYKNNTLLIDTLYKDSIFGGYHLMQ